MAERENRVWFVILIAFVIIAIFNLQASKTHGDIQDSGPMISLDRSDYVLKPGESITITLSALSDENISANIMGENGSVIGAGIVEDLEGGYNITFSAPEEEGVFIISIKHGSDVWEMPIIVTNNPSEFNDTFGIEGLSNTEICFLMIDPAGENTTEELNFIAPDMKATSYKWDFGDGSYADGQKVTHAYVKPGLYTASVNITWPGGYKVFKRPVVVSSYGFIWDTSDGEGEADNIVPDTRENKGPGGGSSVPLDLMLAILVMVMAIITVVIVMIIRRGRRLKESYEDEEDELWDEDEDE